MQFIGRPIIQVLLQPGYSNEFSLAFNFWVMITEAIYDLVIVHTSNEVLLDYFYDFNDERTSKATRFYLVPC